MDNQTDGQTDRQTGAMQSAICGLLYETQINNGLALAITFNSQHY